MLTPVLADMFIKSSTSSSQVAETGRATVDSSFQKIFDSSMQNSAKTSHDVTEPSGATRAETANETDTSKTNSEAKTSSTDTETVNAVSAKTDDEKSADNSESSGDAEKTDEETPADKIEKLKKDDPQSYDSIISNIENMTLGDLLSALGLSTSDMSGLKSDVDLAGVVSEDLKLALKSGDWAGVGSALASLGIGGSGASTSLSTLAGQTTTAMMGATNDSTGASASQTSQITTPLSTATTDAAGESSASLKSDSSASVVTADDSGGAVVSKSSTTGVSADNSNSQTASYDADSGSAGTGADSKSSGSSASSGSVNAAGPETSGASDPLKLAESVSMTSGAQTRADGAAQQTESKSAATSRNLTNKTDQASAVNGQSAKSDQTQTQSNVRSTSSPRQTFERMILDQVVDKARIIPRPGGASSMVIRLDPPSLGRIDMRIDVKDGSVRAAIVADSKDVKAAIEGNIENLKNSLHANGLKVDEISVTVGGDQGFKFRDDGVSQHGAQNNGDGGRGAQGGAVNVSMADAENDSQASRAAYRHNGLLDVVA